MSNDTPHMQKILQSKYLGTRPYEGYEAAWETARKYDHPWWFDGIPVTNNLYNFICEIKAKRPQIVLRLDTPPLFHYIDHIDPGTGTQERVVVRQYNELGITYSDTPTIRLGRIGVTHDAEPKYFVYSKRIANEKYRHGNDGYYTKKSKKMPNMVSVALRELRPYDFADMEGYSRAGLSSAIMSIRDPARSKLHSKLRIEVEDIATELANMILVGYTPSTANFQTAIDLIASEGAELRRLKDYRPRTCFVWAKQNSLMYKYSDADASAIEVTNMNDVPENIRNKVAMLNIADDNCAIADVGVRLDASTFWIFV